MIFNNINNIAIEKSKCPNCNEVIWNFHIDRKNVQLEYFGSPYIDHICEKPDYLKEFLYIVKNVDLITDTELETIVNNIIKEYAPPQNIKKILQYELNRKNLNFSFTEIEPSQSINYAFGKIIYYNSRINIYNEFGIDENSLLAKGLLGKFADTPLDKFVLRDNPDLHNHSHQFTFYAYTDINFTKLLYQSIFVNLEFIELPQNKFWLMKNYKQL